MNPVAVLSFNIRNSSATCDGENHWENRAVLNVATIRRLMPDIICFQELQLGNLIAYEKDLGEYRFLLGPKYNNQAPYCYPAVFWRPEKLRLVGSEEFWVSRTPERHSFDWDTAFVRSVSVVRFASADGGYEFTLLNTHLDNASEQARVEGSKLIIAHVRCRTGQPVVLAGDFNCDPGSVAYRQLLGNGFEDTFIEAGLADGPEAFTFHAFKGLRDKDCGRIDWILVRPGVGGGHFATRSFEIIRDAQPPLFPSDHYPILASLEWVSSEAAAAGPRSQGENECRI
jgi:endonuclease/exonuclease/phosphatase family metal-dependent hydrolase